MLQHRVGSWFFSFILLLLLLRLQVLQTSDNSPGFSIERAKPRVKSEASVLKGEASG